MSFNSLAFWMFFAAVALAYYAVPAAWSRAVLVLASFAFYGAWNPWLVLLLAACVVFNHASGIAISRAGKHRRRTLATAIAANLGMLGMFKYCNFFLDTAANLLHLPADPFSLQIVLPVGISFYTFEAIAYNTDIYRGTLQPRAGILDFALFIAFFPHLVAGPIIRPAQFFPQLAQRRVPSGEAFAWGVAQAIKGLLKKTVFADNFATTANLYFNTQAGQGDMIAAWVGTLAFSMQIYFDFSGYTDIARGCASMLGFQLPPNFERPYLAPDIAAFWRRWHISLSTWLRDYLYIPLGGNRGGTFRTYVNLLVTMGLGGLWHGANWNFVLWGLYHGGLLALHRAWRAARGSSAAPEAGGIGHAAAVACTFVLVTIGWVAFRTPDFATTIRVLHDLLLGSLIPARTPPQTFLLLLGVTATFLWLDRGRRLQTWLYRGGGVAGSLKVAAALATSCLILEVFSRTDIAVPFIYFRF